MDASNLPGYLDGFWGTHNAIRFSEDRGTFVLLLIVCLLRQESQSRGRKCCSNKTVDNNCIEIPPIHNHSATQK